GKGAFGVVFRVREKQNPNTKYALKLLRSDHLGEPTASGLTAEDRFNREAELLKALDHPALPTVVHSGKWKCQPYYTMDLYGESLQSALSPEPVQPPKLWAELLATGPVGVIRFVSDMLDGLAAVHQQERLDGRAI